MDVNFGIILFWIFLTVTAASVTWAGHLGRIENERTVRLAIDKGAVLDGDAIERLKRTASLPWGSRLVAMGIVAVFIGIGICVFALFLMESDPDALMPLMGIASICIFTGLGLGVAGFWLRKISREAR